MPPKSGRGRRRATPPRSESTAKTPKRDGPQDDTAHPNKRRRITRSATSSSKRSSAGAAHDSPPHENDAGGSVLGGMKGGYRVTGKTEVNEGIVAFEVPFEGKDVPCRSYGKDEEEKGKGKGKGKETRMVFTHGAGGGLANPATATFCEGFSTKSPVLAFQGTMNLKSRTKTFHVVVDHVRENQPKGEEASLALGGRSMGARAASISASHLKRIDTVVLVSYPLTSEKGVGIEERAAPLVDLPPETDTLFVTGDADKMCPLSTLNEVRQKMKARSWLLLVEGADHAMSVKGGKTIVERMRKETGRLASEWMDKRDASDTEGLLKVQDGEMVFSGWLEGSKTSSGDHAAG